MPDAIRAGCVVRRCPRRSVRAGRCDVHLPAFEAARGTSTQRGYDSEWERVRGEQLRAQPWCSVCGHTGSRYNPLTVDHIVPLALGGKSEPGNLDVKCRRHNSAKGAR